MSRQVNTTTTEFQSEEKGSIITDPRKFGVELEVVAKNETSIMELASQISTSFGFHHDGSVRGKMGETGVEVVTPILSGKTGELALKDLLDKMNKIGFETNYSCGLHVHHDANNLLPQDGVSVEKSNFLSNGFSFSGLHYQYILYSILKKFGLKDKDLLDLENFSKATKVKLKVGSLNGRIARFGDKKIIFYQLGQYNFITDRNTAHDIFNSEGIGTLTSEK